LCGVIKSIKNSLKSGALIMSTRERSDPHSDLNLPPVKLEMAAAFLLAALAAATAAFDLV
jgi:hypothetical protein